jgi:hypothetical protein
MPVVLGAARAGRGSESDERDKSSEQANPTGRSEATIGRHKTKWQNGRTPELD